MSYKAEHYVHEADKAAFKALKAIPGFHQFIKAYMKIWSERQFRVLNMSSCVRMNEKQLSKYYDMLPPICEKLGIDVPELYLELNVSPNAYTSGDSNPFIVVTSGLFETIPEDLIPTVLAHECGHIACHHVLYNTMGRLLLRGACSTIASNIPYGWVASMPLEIAFFYWMRCSELSADRAAALCDGKAEKMSEVCLRLAGFDKDINAIASKEEFMVQAQEYRNMVKGSKWDKTLEFLALRNSTHPLMTVRALECEEWGKSDQFRMILDGTYEQKETEELEALTGINDLEQYDELDKKEKSGIELPRFIKKEKGKRIDGKLASANSIPDEIRKYKELYDDGILTEEEFSAKKKQLLGLAE